MSQAPETIAPKPTWLSRIPDNVRSGRPTVWFNPQRGAEPDKPLLEARLVDEAVADWKSFEPALARLFPALRASGGVIDSRLLPIDRQDLLNAYGLGGAARLYAKTDHDLPLVGSIKARGGVYEVMIHARDLARRSGRLAEGEPLTRLADGDMREFFSGHRVLTGSTGNLGVSIGLSARALGFTVDVHMSADARAWKKALLRKAGVTVHEHSGDYSLAVATARSAAAQDARSYFIDDEDSLRLFAGYSAAIPSLQRQLAAENIVIGPDNPLVVYLPCGVGGAPGGITFGLKHAFGADVTCVFVEPVSAPCMLVQLAAGVPERTSVYELGLDNRTIADGLAVSSASLLVARTVGACIDAVVTVRDDELLLEVERLWGMEQRLEPSGAAGFAALPRYVAAEPALSAAQAVHVVWTTGGSLLPEADFQSLLARASELRRRTSQNIEKDHNAC